jgi:MFS family permease
VSNLAIILICSGLWSLIAARFSTGFFLAGIYPVGMKIAASWCDKGLGRALGYLVGALVLGTAAPHLLRGLGAGLPWQDVIASVSAAAVVGGLLIYLWVPAGPYLPARSSFSLAALPEIFRVPSLRASAFGYFGHMWELYAFWAFVPLFVRHYCSAVGLLDVNISLCAFAVIAAGAVGCAVGGEIAMWMGSARVALIQLLISGAACVLSLGIFHAPPALFFAALLVWGVTVAGDSPQFSSLIGAHAPRAYVGTAFTIVNCIGFAITAVSIQVLGAMSRLLPPDCLFLLLAPGPILGLYAARRLLQPENVARAAAP